MFNRERYGFDIMKGVTRVGSCFLIICVATGFLWAVGEAYEAADPGEMEISKGESVADERLEIDKKWGVEVLSIRLTANNYMLDFRYRVLDTEKASPLFTWKVKPYLIDQASGAKFLVPSPPKVGSLRSTRKPEANRNYFMMFANPAQFIQKGNRVTVVIGDFKAENLVVE